MGAAISLRANFDADFSEARLWRVTSPAGSDATARRAHRRRRACRCPAERSQISYDLFTQKIAIAISHINASEFVPRRIHLLDVTYHIAVMTYSANVTSGFDDLPDE